MVSVGHFDLHEECQEAMNNQIKMELVAAYTYESIRWHFERPESYNEGAAKFFKKQADEERCHAEGFIKFLIKRGGTPFWKDIDSKFCYSSEKKLSLLDAMQTSLTLECDVNTAIKSLHSLAQKRNDKSLEEFLNPYLKEQVESIATFAKHVSMLKNLRDTDGLAVYLYSKDL